MNQTNKLQGESKHYKNVFEAKKNLKMRKKTKLCTSHI